MNLSKIGLPESLTTLLARGEPLTAAQLATATGKSQPSISLALGKLGERVHRMGAARNTRYALKQDILGLPAEHELIWNGPDATGSMPWQWGRMTYLNGNYLHVRSGQREWLTQGKLPWFLTPLRPQGFLGRDLARANPSFPANPEQWSLAQILHSAIHQVRDPSGAFFFNGVETASWRAPEDAADLGAHYDSLAQQIGSGLPTGSSAGGEQPKFAVNRRAAGRFIVKFTPPRGTPFGERWHALLCLEKLALDTLQSHGITSARSELIQTRQRSYLQSARFDRGEQHSMHHVVAIAAIHDEFVGGAWHNWLHTSEALTKKGLIMQDELRDIARIFAFGHYIGNTDMHSGNLSFFVDDVVAPKIRLAPVYDMLPMMWRPDIHQGSLSDGPVRQQFMAPSFEQEKNEARAWAIEFWTQAQQLDLGAKLQAAAQESAHRLKTNFAHL
jgi:HipA-like C-terminal domain